MRASVTETPSVSRDGICGEPLTTNSDSLGLMNAPNVPPRSAFANRFARLRLALGFTQEQLADKLRVSRTRLSGWENDDSFIRHPELYKMRELTKLDADFILFGDTDGLTLSQERWLIETGVIEMTQENS